MSLRGALFDVDGTLMNVEERFYHHYNENLKAFGIEPVDREHYEHMRASGILSKPLPDNDEARGNFWLRFIENFSSLIEQLIQDNYHIFLIGKGEGEEKRGKYLNDLYDIHDFTGKLSIKEILFLIAHSL